MTKNLVLVCTALILASLSARADDAIPSSSLSTYATAATIAVDAMSASVCRDGAGNGYAPNLIVPKINQALGSLNSGSLASDGSQPLLTLTWEYTPGVERAVVRITTSADYKSAKSVTIEYQKSREVNSGTLLNPSLSTGWVTDTAYTCN